MAIVGDSYVNANLGVDEAGHASAMLVEVTIRGQLIRMSLDEVLRPNPKFLDEARLREQQDQCGWFESILAIAWAVKRKEREDAEIDLDVWLETQKAWAEDHLIGTLKVRLKEHSSSAKDGKLPATMLRFSQGELRSVILRDPERVVSYVEMSRRISQLKQDEVILSKNIQAIENRGVTLASLVKSDRMRKHGGQIPDEVSR